LARSRGVAATTLLAITWALATGSPATAASATNVNFTLPAVTKAVYSISGTVRNAATSAVVPNVQVTASSTSGFGAGSYATTTTNASGAYRLVELLASSYKLHFDPPRATNLQHGYRGGTSPNFFSVATAIPVTITSASLTGRDIRLPTGYKVSGKVTRTNGTTAIANVPVDAAGPSGGDYTTTDSSGAYTLEGLSPGAFTVEYQHDPQLSNQTGCWFTGAASRFSASCAAHSLVTITTANVTAISPRIPNALRITGLVKTRATVPVAIAGAQLEVVGPSDGQAATNASGVYTIAGLNPGKYLIGVRGPAGTRIVDGFYQSSGTNHWTDVTASRSQVTISAAVTALAIIKPATGFYIKGKITNTGGTAVGSVEVQAFGGAGTTVETAVGLTDATGTYSVGPVPAGTSYKIQVAPLFSADPSLESGWYRNNPPNDFTLAPASATSIAVAAADVTGKNMRLPKGASISGVVKVTGGAVCNSCYVALAYDSTGSVASYASPKNGTYKLQGLPAGAYKVELLAAPVVTATHLLLITDGFYKSGAAPNFSATLAGATAVAITP